MPADRIALREAHQAFYDGQLDIQFELHMKTRPRYPKLRDQLAMQAPDGRTLERRGIPVRGQSLAEMGRKLDGQRTTT